MITRTLSELAAELNGELRGDPATMIRGVAGIREALPGDITFIANAAQSPMRFTSPRLSGSATVSPAGPAR